MEIGRNFSSSYSIIESLADVRDPLELPKDSILNRLWLPVHATLYSPRYQHFLKTSQRVAGYYLKTWRYTTKLVNGERISCSSNSTISCAILESYQ
jgi:hypothetical protein